MAFVGAVLEVTHGGDGADTADGAEPPFAWRVLRQVEVSPTHLLDSRETEKLVETRDPSRPGFGFS